MRYAASTNSFYASDIYYKNLPNDCVEIENDAYQLLMQGQAEGKVITSNNDGIPILINRPHVPNTKEENQALALRLLTETDFVEIPSVTSTESIPRLLNKSAFVDYRNQVRIFAVYPVDGNVDWPTKPTEQWSDPFEGVGK